MTVTTGTAIEVILPSASIVQQASSDEDMIARWIGRYRSPATRGGYGLDIRAFRAFTTKPLRAVTVGDMQDFAATLGHLAPATVARRLSAVKSLLGLAHRLGYIPFDVGGVIDTPHIKDVLAERIITESDVQHLLRLERHPRNAALLRLIYGAGLRISEACALLWRDLVARDDAGQCTIFGKGGKTRVILLPAALWNYVVAIRHGAGPDDPVFRSRKKGGPLAPMQVHRIVKAAARRAKLPVAISAHWLRHSHASHALDRGAPVHVVQTTLGHASLTTTTRYSHVRPGDSSAKYLVA
jgi:site-specific recombinase XerD